MNKKIGAIVQARMCSERFPGKVMHKVAGKPILGYLLEGLSQSDCLDAIVVATSIDESDNSIVNYCKELRMPCCRGPLEDVAGRFIEVLNSFKFDAFVRVNGDSPLLDYRLVNKGVTIFNSSHFDLVTNTKKRTFPKGQSVEVVNSSVFRRSYSLMRAPKEREHITSYFYNHSEELSIYNFESQEDYSNIQLSIDTPEDMKRFTGIITKLKRQHWEYPFEDFITMMESNSKCV